MPATLNPFKWSTAFFESNISSYTTKAVPLVFPAAPLHTVRRSIESVGSYFLIWRMAPYFPKISYSSSLVILKGRFLTKIILLTSGGSLAYKKQRVGKKKKFVG